MAETLDSLFRNVESGDKIRHKETGNEAEVIERDQVVTARGKEEGLKVKPLADVPKDKLFLAQTKADEWEVAG